MRNFKSLLLLVALAVAAPAWAAPSQTVEMKVDGLVCAFCAQGINKNLRKQSAVDDVYISLEHKVVAITLKEGQALSDETLRALLTDAGYTLRTVVRSERSLEAIKAEVGS